MGVAGAAIAVMSILDWLIMKGWVPFLAPLGIALVIGTVIAAFAVRTSSPSAGDETTGGPTESLRRWATAVIWVLVVGTLLIPAVLFMIAIPS